MSVLWTSVPPLSDRDLARALYVWILRRATLREGVCHPCLEIHSLDRLRERLEEAFPSIQKFRRDTLLDGLFECAALRWIWKDGSGRGLIRCCVSEDGSVFPEPDPQIVLKTRTAAQLLVALRALPPENEDDDVEEYSRRVSLVLFMHRLMGIRSAARYRFSMDIALEHIDEVTTLLDVLQYWGFVTPIGPYHDRWSNFLLHAALQDSAVEARFGNDIAHPVSSDADTQPIADGVEDAAAEASRDGSGASPKRRGRQRSIPAELTEEQKEAARTVKLEKLRTSFARALSKAQTPDRRLHIQLYYHQRIDALMTGPRLEDVVAKELQELIDSRRDRHLVDAFARLDAYVGLDPEPPVKIAAHLALLAAAQRRPGRRGTMPVPRSAEACEEQFKNPMQEVVKRAIDRDKGIILDEELSSQEGGSSLDTSPSSDVLHKAAIDSAVPLLCVAEVVRPVHVDDAAGALTPASTVTPPLAEVPPDPALSDRALARLKQHLTKAGYIDNAVSFTQQLLRELGAEEVDRLAALKLLREFVGTRQLICDKTKADGSPDLRFLRPTSATR